MRFSVYYKDDFLEYVDAKDHDEAYQLVLDQLEVAEDESEDL